MMKRLVFSVICLFMALASLAQMPELTLEQHLEDYDYAVRYIEDNYAGFPDKVVDSTRTDYETMKNRLRAQVANGERPGWNAVVEYSAWFNDRHLKIQDSYANEKGERINWTEDYWKKKGIHYEAMMEYEPAAIACKVTDKTFLIRFPSCSDDVSDTKWIKNSIKQFKKSHCENLVIDIRGNGGGDARWTPYMVLLYDHEGIIPGPEFRNTPQNIQWHVDYEKTHKVKSRSGEILKKVSLQHPNSEFIRYPDGGNVKDGNIVRKYNKVDKSVKKAAIIIDNANGSNTEAMVSEIKATSYRTTVFGRDNTSGCLDYSSLSFFHFKYYDCYFAVPTSRRIGLPETGIDATGIAPDVRIPLPLPARLTDNIDEWVIWVAEQLEK